MPASPPEREPSSRNIYAFGVTSLLNDTATEMAYWVLPAFLVSLGAGPAQLGLIEGVAESVASFAQLFSGYLTDHVHRISQFGLHAGTEHGMVLDQEDARTTPRRGDLAARAHLTRSRRGIRSWTSAPSPGEERMTASPP